MSNLSTEIINKIEQSRNQIIRLYHSVPVTEILEPNLPSGESVKTVLAQMAAWEWRCAELLAQSHDSTAPLQAKPDVYELNREFRQERQEWEWEEVEMDFRLAHESLLAAIRALPAQCLQDDLVQQTIGENSWEMYEKHLPDMRRWHKRVSHRRR